MTRRDFIHQSAALAVASAAAPLSALTERPPHFADQTSTKPLALPKGPIRVAFLISEGFQMIDFAGPWEIFQDVANPKTGESAFELFTVSRTGQPVKASGGLKVTPDHAFADAPTPHVLVVPAQQDSSPEALAWIRQTSAKTNVTMSVCTGAFLLAQAGLLDGLPATTHHGAYEILAADHPKVKVRERVRFVDTGHIATSSGLSAGIDLALHVVARYFGPETADKTAAHLEYVGYGWKNPRDTGDLFVRIEKARHEGQCPVCHMDPMGAKIATRYGNKTYRFCSEECRKIFLKQPKRYAKG